MWEAAIYKSVARIDVDALSAHKEERSVHKIVEYSQFPHFPILHLSALPIPLPSSSSALSSYTKIADNQVSSLYPAAAI